MHGPDLLRELVLTYALALGLLLIAARLRVPSLVALMAAGMLASPSALAIIRTRENVDLLAEVGIVLLLFTVGLEFSIRILRRLWITVLLGGVLQMTLTTVAVLAIASSFGAPWRLGLFLGLFVALSSTAILLRELAARNQVDAPHGRVVIGVLLFQDLAVVILMVLLPSLLGSGAVSSLWLVLGRTLIAIAIVFVGASFVLPRLLRLVAPSRTREAFSLAVFLTSLGVAWMTAQFGISMALGAFLAGLVLADTEFSHQIHAEVRPIRDILASLFFISVGLLVDPVAILTRLPSVLAVVAIVVTVKVTAAATALGFIRIALRPAIIASVVLVPIGEFSFIFARAGLSTGVLSQETWQLLLGASILTMAAGPGLVSVAPGVGYQLARWLRRPEAAESALLAVREDHVVILGFGVGGRLLAQALAGIGTPYVVLEMNATTVREAAALGIPIRFGDATNIEALEGVGAARARAVVALLSDPDATGRAVRTARRIAPRVPVIARARYRQEADELQHAGATLAVAEELEASLEVLAQLLARLGVPGNTVEPLVDRYRRESTAGRPIRAPALPLTAMPQALQDLPVSTHHMSDGDWGIGRSLAEINLRASTGATVLAIKVGREYVTSPAAGQVLEAGHVLYLLGDASDVLLARDRLTSGPR
jgi:CPA2 family monovalent cation:H+ antiporter-2